MKKLVALIAFVGMVCGTVFALTPAEEKKLHYQEVKKIKDAQRQQRDTEEKSAEAKTPSKMEQFWKKEGERSGLGGSGNRMGNFLKNLNPVPFFKDQQDKYNARKTQGGVK